MGCMLVDEVGYKCKIRYYKIKIILLGIIYFLLEKVKYYYMRNMSY